MGDIGLKIMNTDLGNHHEISKLGTIKLSPDILFKANIGLWAFELDEGREPRMYVDDAMLGLLGLDHQISPEETYHTWYDHIDEGSYGLVADAVNKMSCEHAEVQYPWHHPSGSTMIVRSGGVRNFEYTKGIRIEGTHQNVTEVLHFDEEEVQWLKRAEIQLRHEKLRAEVLNCMVDHDDDPIELLKVFAERIRELLACDQVVYHDLEETRIMVNSNAIEDTWAVPIDYCKQCAHFDAHHPVYSDGYIEMANCQEGWRGIPVYEKCPIKSSLTRLVYCDGETVGYLAIHYVQTYHTFTDIERSTLEEFARILSIALSRYESNRRSSELDSIRKVLNMVSALSDEYDPILIIDPKTGEYDCLMSMAEKAKEDTGIPLHGMDFFKEMRNGIDKFVHDDDKESFKEFCSAENIRRIAEKGVLGESENRWFIPSEKRYRWKYDKVVRMIDDNGKVYVVIGVVDTTEAKAKEEIFAIQRKMIEEQQALSDGLAREFHTVWMMDSFGDHKLHFYRTTGVTTLKPAVQMGIDDPCYDSSALTYIARYVHEEDRERVIEATKFDTIVRETPEIGTYVVTYRRYNEEHTDFCYHQMCFAKALAADGSLNYILAFRDADKMMREQIAQQQQLEEALQMAKSANKAKTEFLFNMSHDIRTPMNAIIGFTNKAIKHIDNSEKVLDCLSKIQQSGQLLLFLINGILDMSRIESGHATVEQNAGDVMLSYASFEETMQQLADTKGINLSFEFGNIRDRFVYCDFNRCTRVFVNIITNGIKYTNKGGYVKVRCEQIESDREGFANFRYTFEDNGIGMSEEFQKHVFEQFSREKSTTNSGVQGTGLGLAVCRSFVDLMGGTISFVSKQGVGTTFTVTLPLKLQKGEEYTDPRTGDVISAGRGEKDLTVDFTGKRALLVEDNELNREIAVELLEEGGFSVEEAEDGTIAVEKLKEFGPDYYDYVLMDIQMPVMNGYEATKKIREMYPDRHIPVIALSANAFAEDKYASIRAGMDDHIAKPINIKELFKVLSKFA